MVSETILVQAASGLSQLMAGKPVDGAIKDSTVAQVSAAIFYQSHVMANLINNQSFKSAFSNIIFDQINKDFGEYIDAKARISPKSFHHVYEWQRSGQKEARLFKLNKLPADFVGFNLNYELLNSTSMVPTGKGSHRHVFVNKASIMESGKPVVISPKYSERLVFKIDGETIFMPKGNSVTVTKPGGVATKNSFLFSYKHFFTSNLVNNSIKTSGFQRLFNSSLTKALRIPINIKTVKYSFSPNVVANQAKASLDSAFRGMVNA